MGDTTYDPQFELHEETLQYRTASGIRVMMGRDWTNHDIYRVREPDKTKPVMETYVFAMAVAMADLLERRTKQRNNDGCDGRRDGLSDKNEAQKGAERGIVR